jgi:hypothetical protein
MAITGAPPPVGVALADDVERLQQRHAGFHHGGELACEQGDVLVRDAATASRLLLLDLGRQDALAAQRGVDHRLALGAHLALDHLSSLVLPLIDEDEVLDFVLCRCSCGHIVSRRNRLIVDYCITN